MLISLTLYFFFSSFWRFWLPKFVTRSLRDLFHVRLQLFIFFPVYSVSWISGDFYFKQITSQTKLYWGFVYIYLGVRSKDPKNGPKNEKKLSTSLLYQSAFLLSSCVNIKLFERLGIVTLLHICSFPYCTNLKWNKI